MTFRVFSIGQSGLFFILILAVLALSGCSPREQTRGKRWKSQVDAFLQGKVAPDETAWPVKPDEDEEGMVLRRPVTFAEVVEGLPHPQSWPQLQNGLVLRFLAAQSKGEWRAEVQNRLLHLFLIYLNDLDRYSTRRWDKAVERLNRRLDVLEGKLSGNASDLVVLDQVRKQIATADGEVQKRFGKGDSLAEVRIFEERMKKLQPLERAEVAALVGGELELAKMEKLTDEITLEFAKLIQKYGGKSGGELEKNMKALSAASADLRERFEVRSEPYAEVMKQPLVQRFFMERVQSEGAMRVQSIQVPDLVTILGEAKAAELLKRALLLPLTLEIPTGEASRALARKLALQYVDQVKAPQWELTESLQGVSLFEALQKRFPARSDEEGGDYQRNRAEVYYLFGLIAQGRSEEALKWMAKVYPSLSKDPEAGYRWSVPSALLEQMELAGYQGEVWNFLAKLLDRYPDLPFWDEFIELSSQLGKNPAMLTLVERTAQRPGLKEATRWTMQKNLAAACLASDRVEEGVAVIRAALAQSVTDEDLLEERYQMGLQLAGLGQLLQRSDWIEEGLAVAEGHVAKLKPDELDYYQVGNLVSLYEKLARVDDAERILKNGLNRIALVREAAGRKAVANSSGNEEEAEEIYLSENSEAQFLESLLGLYAMQGRQDEALRLLTESPHWGQPDLANFLEDSAGYPEHPVGYWAAWVLAKSGRADEAGIVARGQIRVQPGSDGAYSILTQLRGEAAIPFLEKIYRMDQFEERPLIWKAKVLCDAGNLNAAEEAAQAAIAVDPSDGEQGKGDRMRVYSVLAEIEKKRGNAEKAVFFENVMQAIRLSEEADDYDNLGLNTRAIAIYQEALGFFSDAYCIQSRLALQLSKEKREAEALVHYAKAYELMPNSFGRVESHCFGCEDAFEGEKAQGIAEKVFLDLLKKQPGKPQVHYLLGYLREEQKRYGDALAFYRQAVALDPLYLNAWKHIAGLKNKIRLDPHLLDQVQLKLLALDPLGRHSSPDLRSVNDLPKLWGHVALADRVVNIVPVPDAVFELTASAEVLRNKEAESDEPAPEFRNDQRTFAKILLQHPAVQSLHLSLEATKKESQSGEFPMEEFEVMEY